MIALSKTVLVAINPGSRALIASHDPYSWLRSQYPVSQKVAVVASAAIDQSRLPFGMMGLVTVLIERLVVSVRKNPDRSSDDL